MWFKNVQDRLINKAAVVDAHKLPFCNGDYKSRNLDPIERILRLTMTMNE